MAAVADATQVTACLVTRGGVDMQPILDTLMSVDYYNGFRDRLVDDYRIRNRRVVAALAFAREHLAGASSILDVGCGIGWTTDELVETGADVIGIDVSPVLISTARSMFPARRFITADFLAWEPSSVDAVVMIDVFEHFQRDARAAVHERIRATGARRIVLTTPTPDAMQYARDNSIPLQLIDEDVTDEDIAQLADDLGGQVAVNRLVTIWRPNDYRHVLITC